MSQHPISTRISRPTRLDEILGRIVAELGRLRPAARTQLPAAALRDHDPALYDALLRVEQERTLLAATRRPLLY